MMKKSAAILFALVAIFCVGLSSCGKSGSDSDSANGSGISKDASVVGYWVSEDGELGAFKEDGTMIGVSELTSIEKNADTGEILENKTCRYFSHSKYSVENDKIIVTKDGESKTVDIVSLGENEMSCKVGDKTTSFKRISEDEYKAKTQDVLSERPADF